MEEDFEEQTTRFGGYFSRTLVGHAHQGICIAYLVNTNGGSSVPPLVLPDTTFAENACFCGCYLVSNSLAHFGLVDQLAPAGSMHEFVEYTKGLEQKEAQACFAEPSKVFKSENIKITVIYNRNEWEEILQSLQAKYQVIYVIE